MLAAATDQNNGMVLTDANGNTVGTAAFTPQSTTNFATNANVNGGSTNNAGSTNVNSGCMLDVQFCADVCGADGIRVCDW